MKEYRETLKPMSDDDLATMKRELLVEMYDIYQHYIQLKELHKELCDEQFVRTRRRR